MIQFYSKKVNLSYATCIGQISFFDIILQIQAEKSAENKKFKGV